MTRFLLCLIGCEQQRPFVEFDKDMKKKVQTMEHIYCSTN